MRKLFLWCGLVSLFAGGARAGTITENFDGGTFNSDFFEFAHGTGLIVDGRMISLDRALFRTLRNDLVPTASTPLAMQADLTFLTSPPDIAFMAWRSDGLTEPINREPNRTLYYRIHNFIGGEVNLALGPNTSSGPNYPGFLLTTHNPGDAFWTAGQTIRISVVDDGSEVSSTFVNLSTGATFTDSAAVATSMPTNYVAFSGNVPGALSVAWDNIAVSHAAIPEPSTSLLLSIGLVGLLSTRRRQPVR
jgi:hypothetical protein